MEYWKTRAREAEERAYKSAAQLSLTVYNAYWQSAKAIREQINDFYTRYAREQKLTYDEAVLRLNTREAQEWRKTVADYLAEIEAEEDKDIRAKLEADYRARSYASRVTRLEALNAEIQMEMNRLAVKCEKHMREEFGAQLVDSYDRKMFDIQSRVGYASTFVGMDPKMIGDAVDYPWSGASFSERLWQSKEVLGFSLQSILTKGMISGTSGAQMSKQLSDAMGKSFKVAERLVRTETNRIHAEADMRAYEAAGIKEYEYMCGLDEATCEVCGALDGKHFPIKDAEPGKNYPPMHPNCVLPDTIIIAPDMEAMIKGVYSGDVVEIGTANGTGLTVTANHIVLTARGWVRAKNLVKGDKIIRYCGRDEPVVETNPAYDNGIPTVEKLFAALVKASAMPPLSVPVTAEDLKGDIAPDSEVDIVFINGELRNKLDPALHEFVCDVPLVGTGECGKRHLFGKCTLAEFLVGAGLASDGIMSGLGVAKILLGGSLGHHKLVSLRRTSDYDARLQKTANDRLPRDAEALCDFVLADTGVVKRNDFISIESDSNPVLGNAISFKQVENATRVSPVEISNLFAAFPGVVALDDVIFVANKFYSGHIYDASSLSTLYIANGVLSSNCRCTTIEYDPEDAADWAAAGEPMPENETYEKWKAKQDKEHGEGYVDRERQKAYNADGDQKQYERYAARLGSDAPDGLDEFQTVKYENPEAWRDLKELYAYKGRVAEATRRDFELYRKVKATGIAGSIRVPPEKINAAGLTFLDSHAGRHGATLEDARSYVETASVSIRRKRWDGVSINFYSKNGAAYIDEEGKIKTSFSQEDYDTITAKALEVFK